MIGLITRFLFMTAGLLGGYAVSQLIDWEQEIGLSGYYVIIIFIILGWSFGYLLGGIVGRELTSAWSKAEDRIRDLEPSDLILGASGLVVGLLAALLFSQPLRLIQPAWLGVLSTVGLSALLAYIGVRAALVKKREFAALFPHSADEEQTTRSQQLLLDTSAIIDARFVELRRLGFLQGSPRVPRFVLSELQTLADSADDTRRARGRRGLDLLETLPSAEVEVFEIDYPDIPDVDHKLLRLAAETGGAIVTVDHNLSKVARVSGLDVRNLHELAASLRPSFLPGDSIQLRVLKQGKEPNQGVGYLEDGTMVVVQDGKPHVGSDIDAEVTSVLQTSAGRMVFARPAPTVPKAVSA